MLKPYSRADEDQGLIIYETILHCCFSSVMVSIFTGFCQAKATRTYIPTFISGDELSDNRVWYDAANRPTIVLRAWGTT